MEQQAEDRKKEQEENRKAREDQNMLELSKFEMIMQMVMNMKK